MRKIIALVLTVTTVVVLFTACTGNGGSEITTDPLSTSDTTTTTESTTTTAPDTTGPTYVLTTNQNKQAPWYSTTRFEPDAAPSDVTPSASQSTSVSNMYENITYPTSGMTPSVSAVTSAAKTTEWSTIPTNTTTATTTATKATESTTAATTTEAVEATGMQAVINSTWFDGDGNFCAAIDKEGWGKIKSNSVRIPVYIDGVEADKPATLQISSSVDGDGCQYVFVNVSKYDVLNFGSVVSFEIPEGFLKNTSGTKYNCACYVSSKG